MGRIRTCDLRVMSPASWPLLYHAKSWSLTIAFRSPLQEVRRFFWLRIRYRGRSTLPVFLTSIIARQHSPGVILWTWEESNLRLLIVYFRTLLALTRHAHYFRRQARCTAALVAWSTTCISNTCLLPIIGT